MKIGKEERPDDKTDFEKYVCDTSTEIISSGSCVSTIIETTNEDEKETEYISTKSVTQQHLYAKIVSRK